MGRTAKNQNSHKFETEGVCGHCSNANCICAIVILSACGFLKRSEVAAKTKVDKHV